jgi:ATP-dependent DNA helicase RecG
MNLSEIKTILARLDGATAEDLESETLEFKSWDPSSRVADANVRMLREAVVCFANAKGGIIILGVGDRKRTRHEAIEGVPPDLDPEQLRVQVFRGTDPAIMVEVQTLDMPEGKRLMVVRVPRGVPPHTTSGGYGCIRVGKHCEPLTGSRMMQMAMTGGMRDPSADIVYEAKPSDLDVELVRELKRRLATEGGQEDLGRLDDAELLSNLGLVQGDQVTFTAVLLMGTSMALARFCPQHEVVFTHFTSDTEWDQRRSLKGPLLKVLDVLQRLLEPHLMTTVAREAQGFHETAILDFNWMTLRESVLNALVHRDYFRRQAVMVTLYSDRLEVSNPGGLMGGVTTTNILRHPPVHRNALLADVLMKAGLVNRNSVGVDRIYDSMLRTGCPAPHYEADESGVKLTLRRKVHRPFAEFVAIEEREKRKLSLDDLLVLRSCLERGRLDRRTATAALQTTEEDIAAAKLAELRARGFLEVNGRGRTSEYHLGRKLSDEIRGSHETDLDFSVSEEAAKLRIQKVLAERGKLTNEDVRRLAQVSRSEAVRIMRELILEKSVVLQGKGRGAHYEPGPKLSVGEPGKSPKRTKKDKSSNGVNLMP